jgi:hypothetical protein
MRLCRVGERIFETLKAVVHDDDAIGAYRSAGRGNAIYLLTDAYFGNCSTVSQIRDNLTDHSHTLVNPGKEKSNSRAARTG